MICFHKWGKWSDPRETIMGNDNDVGFYAVAQIRICEKCGVAQYKRLPELRSIKGIKKSIEREYEVRK